MGKIIISSVSTNEKVFIEMSGGTDIHYTLDGTDPTASSLKYSARIDYPSRCLIKAKDVSDVSGEIASYQCGKPMCWNAWSVILKKECLIVTEPIDFAKGNNFPLPGNVVFIGNGAFMNANNFALNGKNEFLPSVLTESKFVNCGDWKKWYWKKGQLINENGVLQQWNGSTFVAGTSYDDRAVKEDIKQIKGSLGGINFAIGNPADKAPNTLYFITE